MKTPTPAGQLATVAKDCDGMRDAASIIAASNEGIARGLRMLSYVALVATVGLFVRLWLLIAFLAGGAP